MSLNVITKTITLRDGREIILETGKLAKQADGAVVVRMGDTMILATVVSSLEAKAGVDFLPLSVDYQEKFAAAGRIPGGFLRREGRLSDFEILISRLVDRAIRPLFPDDYHAETQVSIMLISADANAQPDALAALAASAALAVSDIPFNGPISEVRVVKIGNEFKINPVPEDIAKADLDLIVAASYDNILMVEGESNEVSEEDMLNALMAAHEAIKDQCKVQLELAAAAGKTEKRVYSHETSDESLKADMNEKLYDQVYAISKQAITNKHLRLETISNVKKQYVESLGEDHGKDPFLINSYFHGIEKKAARNLVLDEQRRLDGRNPTQIRPIWSEVNYLPTAHGSAIFTRGETQSLTTVTLGTKLDEQMIDAAMVSGSQKFILHYNFPGFSTGEVKINRGTGRREVGHGNLAMRALRKVLPPEDQNPYTIRVVSDILESNGSSSMATVCAGALALMDAGVKISRPVSGIAMGMISDPETGKYAILSDILGDEDHLGDMDFKVTGTSKGITACQMDIKINGLSYEILAKALHQAKEGRLHILNEIKKTLAEPRDTLKPNAPRIISFKIEKEFIGAVIGPGGKVIQEIQKETKTTIVIEEKDNMGVVSIYAPDESAVKAAEKRIKLIVAVPEVGEVYDGKVKSITSFGAFVEFMPGKEGLLHISEIKWDRLRAWMEFLKLEKK